MAVFRGPPVVLARAEDDKDALAFHIRESQTIADIDVADALVPANRFGTSLRSDPISRRTGVRTFRQYLRQGTGRI